MSVAFVLIRTDAGTEADVYRGLLEIEGIEEIFPLFGEYDFIAKISAADFDALGLVVFRGIRSLHGVKRTETLTATKL